MALVSLLTRLEKQRDVWAVAFLIAWPLLLFWQITIGAGVWYGTDIVRDYHPLGFELGRALSEGRLPLWTTGISSGFPLFAEGQFGALYPLNLILFKILPTHFAISYDLLFHLVWAGVGLYACARSLRLRLASSLFAAILFSTNGFMMAQLFHEPIVLAGSWLPWLVFLSNRMFTARESRKRSFAVWMGLLVCAFAALFLIGHPHTAFLDGLTYAAFGLFALFFDGRFILQIRREGLMELARSVTWLAIPPLLGAGIAAIQLVPTAELISYTPRGDVLPDSYTLNYSLPPAFLSQFISPFSAEEPSEVNNEYWAYLGLTAFAFAILAPFLRRDRRTVFWFGFALVALSFALGRLSPVYTAIYHMPLFSLFRVPARYLLPFVFAAALTSAAGLESLAMRLSSPSGTIIKVRVGMIAVCISVCLGWILFQNQTYEFWIKAWRVLPFVLAALTGMLLLFAWTRRIDHSSWVAGVIGVALLDLAGFAVVMTLSINRIVAPSYVDSVPRSISALEDLRSTGRVFTDVVVDPSTPAARGSLYRNTSLVYGWQSVQAYTPLALARNERYLTELGPAMLDLLNVRYVAVPLEPRASEKALTPPDGLGLDILNNEVQVPQARISRVRISSFTEQGQNLPIGAVIAQVELRIVDGKLLTFPLRNGIETADWDAERKPGAIPQTAEVANTFPAFWRSFGRAFQGHTYRAQWDLPETSQVVGVQVRTVVPGARLVVESVALENQGGKAISLAEVSGKGEYRVAYLSDTVAFWENKDVLPRVMIMHDADVVDDEMALAQMQAPGFQPAKTLLLSEGESMHGSVVSNESSDSVQITRYEPESVSISAKTDQRGFLVLGDSWYPGWNAFVDGKPAAIYRADVMLRAIMLDPGNHTIVLEYKPLSLVLGALVSFASVLVLLGVLLILVRRTVA